LIAEFTIRFRLREVNPRAPFYRIIRPKYRLIGEQGLDRTVKVFLELKWNAHHAVRARPHTTCMDTWFKQILYRHRNRVWIQRRCYRRVGQVCGLSLDIHPVLNPASFHYAGGNGGLGKDIFED